MKAIQHAFGQPLRPLGMFLPPLSDPELSVLVWDQVYCVPEPGVSRLSVSSRELTQMREILDILVARALDRFGDDGHMLCLGFRRGGHGSFETRRSGGKVECRFPNWIVSFLSTPNWDRLLAALGDESMLRLLWDFPLLAIKRGKSFLQLTGRPLPHLLRPKPPPLATPVVANKAKLDSFVRPGSRVSVTQARNLALKICSIKPNKRTRLSPSFIRALPLLRRMLENHRKCPYAKLYADALVSKSSCTEELLVGLRRKETPLGAVSQFVTSALLRVVPKPLWGGQQRYLLSKVREVLRAPSQVRFDIREVLRGLDPSKFSWVEHKTCLSHWVDFLVATMARDMMRSRFVQLVSPHGEVAFFPHSAYREHVVNDYLAENDRQFVKIEDQTLARQRMQTRRFPAVKPRFGLKPNRSKFRLILNLSCRTREFPFPANVHFRPAFHALSFEVENQMLGGSFVQGMDAIYDKYVKFRRQVGNKPVFCVAVDVERCFDTMRPEVVLEVARDALRHGEYAMSTKAISFKDEGLRRVRTKRLKLVNPSDRDELSLLHETKLPSTQSSYIATDGISRQFVSRERVLELVQELLFHTYVEFDAKSLYVMRQGVPQGAVLSTLLCRLYYGRFETEELGAFTASPTNLLMRFVDDFIFFSVDEMQVRAFEEKMTLGNTRFACYVNSDKLQRGSTQRWLPWCGLMFHTQKGWVRFNFLARDTYSGARVFARGLGHTLRATARVKLHALLLDLEINSADNAFVNVAQLFVLCATRVVKYVRFVRRRVVGLASTLEDLFKFVFAIIQARLRGGEWTLGDVQCLGWLAFSVKLKRHQLDSHTLRLAFQASVKRRRRKFAGQKLSWARIERAVAQVAASL